MKQLFAVAALSLAATSVYAGGQGPTVYTSYNGGYKDPVVTQVKEPLQVTYLPGVQYQRCCCCCNESLSVAMHVAAGPHVVVTGGETHKFYVWEK